MKVICSPADNSLTCGGSRVIPIGGGNSTVFHEAPVAGWLLSGTQPLLPLYQVVDLERQLDALAELLPGWDGYGARQIQPAVIENCRELIRYLAPAGIPAPDITPNPNGTVSFEWESDYGYSQLEIGLTRTSFYAKPVGGTATRFDGDVASITAMVGRELGQIAARVLGPKLTVRPTTINFAPNFLIANV